MCPPRALPPSLPLSRPRCQVAVRVARLMLLGGVPLLLSPVLPRTYPPRPPPLSPPRRRAGSDTHAPGQLYIRTKCRAHADDTAAARHRLCRPPPPPPPPPPLAQKVSRASQGSGLTGLEEVDAEAERPSGLDREPGGVADSVAERRVDAGNGGGGPGRAAQALASVLVGESALGRAPRRPRLGFDGGSDLRRRPVKARQPANLARGGHSRAAALCEEERRATSAAVGRRLGLLFQQPADRSWLSSSAMPAGNAGGSFGLVRGGAGLSARAQPPSPGSPSPGSRPMYTYPPLCRAWARTR
jgi:hypothetical protein